MATYLYSKKITNSPLYHHIDREAAFSSYPEIQSSLGAIRSEVIIRHFDNLEIHELIKGILLTQNDGAIYPIDLAIQSNNLIGLDSLPLVSYYEWFSNWVTLDKGMTSMFKTIVLFHNELTYDNMGNYLGLGIPESIYTFFDCKYFGLK